MTTNEPAGSAAAKGRRVDCRRPVADCCCPHSNFHTNTEAADAYRRAHPDMTGQLFGQTEAVQAAWQAFGSLLDPSNPQERTP